MADGAALPEWLHFDHRKLPPGNANELRNEKAESSGTTSQDVGRLAISFPVPNRNTSHQVQLRSVSSLFRRPNNRNQIRISVREKTAAVHFVVHQPISNEFSFFFTATGRPLSTAATKLL